MQAIYFQTEEMRKTFAAFPELLFIDATYKLNDLRMPVYIMLVEDGNGESEIVCIWIVNQEDNQTITKMMESFKKHNGDWEKVECIISDKDMTERQVLKEQLPQSDLQICLFHVLKAMRREITAEKLGISQAERQLALEILTKIVYSKTEASYQELKKQLEDSTPKSVYDYFEKNWDAIRMEWVEGLKSSNFLNRTNNRLESINAKLKSVVTRYSDMVSFFQDLMKCIASLKTEQNQRAVNTICKTPLTSYRTESHKEYGKLLTPFAYSYVKKELDKAEQAEVLMLDGGSMRIKIGQTETEIAENNCKCTFFTSMKLPCRHIIASRKHAGKSLYDETLCADRWQIRHYKKSHRVLNPSTGNPLSEDHSLLELSVLKSCNKRTMTEQEKYREAFKTLQGVAEQMSHFGTDDFLANMETLKTLQTQLAAGRRIALKDDAAQQGWSLACIISFVCNFIYLDCITVFHLTVNRHSDQPTNQPTNQP